MPIRDPFKLQLALDKNFRVKICRRCGARNSWNAERCRRCKSTALRPKRYKK
ncbi:MAG: 50S ribosomal protein L40e [Thermofilum sp.]|jgi:large subunit ribosomal protein L40e|nr:50S ribosomal protein L40e [Thermofilum sp.]MCC6064422.1 50S ribosomal protein L40e [Thermofilum sp.]